jgi:RNA polymerase subunit RPABC4/transcription elongation factor Spt4
VVLAAWPGGSWEATVRLIGVVGGAYLALLWLSAMVWTYRDIQARTRDQLTHIVSVLLVLVFNVFGLFVYLVLRPKETLAEAYERQLEAEALLREVEEQASCPGCRRRVRDDYVLCPYCRTRLRETCDSCGRLVGVSWQVCAYCGAERRIPAAVTASRQPVRRSAARITAAATSRAPEPASPNPAPAEPEGL